MFNDDKRNILLTLIVIALVLFSPILARWALDEKTYPSQETYYNLRMVDQFKENGVRDVDVLQNKAYNFNLFHYIFSKLNINVQSMANYFPALFGILTLFLIYILLKTLNLGQNDIFFAMIILATTPIFLYDFTTFTPEILVFPLLILALILFLRGNYLSSIILGLTAFFNIFYTLMGLILILGWHFFKKKNNYLLYANIGIIICASIVGIFVFKINYLTSFIPSILGINAFLIEFGAVKGYALITVILAIIGLFSWWKTESSKIIILISVCLLILFSVFFIDSRLPIALIIAVFAGFSISYLVNREWEIHMLKGVTLLLIICILIFSAVLTINFQIKNITEEKVVAMSYLSSAEPGDLILSVERNGFIIEYESGRSAYLDGNSFKFSDYQARKDLVDKIYYARNLNDLELSLKKEKITHILIDSEMKAGEIWDGRSEGLLFFLENSDKFIKIFYDDDVQIYRYVGEETK
jgi:hypothetical protein